MAYAMILITYYGCVLILLAPWALLLVGAVRRMRERGGRLRRFQTEGAVLAMAGSVSKWIVYDLNFGPDRLGITNWGYWFSRGEVGIFFVGLLMFGLGYFLERRPRPGLTPWPGKMKTISAIAILSSVPLSVIALAFFNYPWFELPWDGWRILLTLGVLPFSLGYWMLSKRR